MSLHNLKKEFSLPEDVIFLNTASFSPTFKSVEIAGINAVKAKNKPYAKTSNDFFEPLLELRQLFSKIIDTEDFDRVVTLPSVSYGMATVANNIKLQKGDEILVIEGQFPSNFYIWQELADKYNAKIITINKPQNSEDWNAEILNAISDKTALVAMGQIHWANGILFDLKAIRTKTKQYDSLLVIDGSQSIGALPFSIKDIQPDALICAGYKWLFGPYGCAYGYFGAYFDNGKPIEQNWSTRLGSENFSGLTKYESKYRPLAQRYSPGQAASFIYVKIQIAALKEILKIKPKELQAYCDSISKDVLVKLNAIGYNSEVSKIRAKHLFGIKIPDSVNLERLKSNLKVANIHVSFRGDYIRVSSHLFNSTQHFEKLYETLKRSL